MKTLFISLFILNIITTLPSWLEKELPDELRNKEWIAKYNKDMPYPDYYCVTKIDNKRACLDYMYTHYEIAYIGTSKWYENPGYWVLIVLLGSGFILIIIDVIRIIIYKLTGKKY